MPSGISRLSGAKPKIFALSACSHSAERRLVDPDQAVGIRGDEEEVVPRAQHRLHGRRVERVGEAVLAEPHELEQPAHARIAASAQCRRAICRRREATRSRPGTRSARRALNDHGRRLVGLDETFHAVRPPPDAVRRRPRSGNGAAVAAKPPACAVGAGGSAVVGMTPDLAVSRATFHLEADGPSESCDGPAGGRHEPGVQPLEPNRAGNPSRGCRRSHRSRPASSRAPRGRAPGRRG